MRIHPAFYTKANSVIQNYTPMVGGVVPWPAFDRHNGLRLMKDDAIQ